MNVIYLPLNHRTCSLLRGRLTAVLLTIVLINQIYSWCSVVEYALVSSAQSATKWVETLRPKLFFFFLHLINSKGRKYNFPPPSPPCNVVPLFWLPIENSKHPNFEWRGQRRGTDSFGLRCYPIWVQCLNNLSPIVDTACDSKSNCSFCTFKLTTVTPRTVLYHNVCTLLVLPSWYKMIECKP